MTDLKSLHPYRINMVKNGRRNRWKRRLFLHSPEVDRSVSFFPFQALLYFFMILRKHRQSDTVHKVCIITGIYSM